jgi:hypothetical protein
MLRCQYPAPADVLGVLTSGPQGWQRPMTMPLADHYALPARLFQTIVNRSKRSHQFAKARFGRG